MRRAGIDNEGLRELVDRFYARVRRDPEIGPVFNAAVQDWDEHLARLADFWSSVMLTSGRYKGDPFNAHLRQPVESPMFARWLALWEETTAELFQPEPAAALQARARRIGDSLRIGIELERSGLRGALGSARRVEES